MKSIYYNWKKAHHPQNNNVSEEETWGQFVDLEINDYYNDQYKKNQYTSLMKYEPSLFTIQENVVNIQSKIIIYDSSYALILSMTALGLYTFVQIFMKYVSKYYG
jgi:3'-phosphoadenosine 5'-phosphosulfate sulfotransferase (PAPS reductase)/FAD synthetase